MTDYHVIGVTKCRWAVRKQNAERAYSILETQPTAVKVASGLCQEDGDRVIIHDRNARVVSVKTLRTHWDIETRGKKANSRLSDGGSDEA